MAAGWRATIIPGLATAAFLALGGCVSTPKASDAWVGGDPAHLAADEKACREESAAVDVNAVGGYSDPRYGVTSAMAAEIAKDNPLTDTKPQIRAATYAACMGDKGWRQP